MHQIPLWPGVAPTTLLGQLTALPRPTSWISGVLHLREKGERRKKGKGGEVKDSGKWKKSMEM